MIGDDDIKRVRDANDIVALVGERLVLRQRGREFWGCCPFHNEKTPSFKVDPASQFYHCFGCGEGGDVFKFVMRTENIDFLDAVRALAQRANIEIAEAQGEASRGKKARLLAVCEETTAFYHQQLMRLKSPAADAARDYLAQRSLGGNIPKQWRLGFALGNGVLVRHLQSKGFTSDELEQANVAFYPTGPRRVLRDRFFNRIMFPIADLQGRPIAFGGRVVGQGEPKYLNSSDVLLFHKRDNLFAIDRAKAPITATGSAIVVEGYTDVIAMHTAGFPNTVATLGTALTPQHLKLLARFTARVVLLFDGDEAGKRAADRAAELIGVVMAPEVGRKVDLFVATLPGKADPADLCAAEGATGMQAVLDGAVPLLRFALDRRLANWDLTSPEQRVRALDDVVVLLTPVKGTLLAADYLNYLADVFAVDYQVAATALARARPLPTPRVSSTDAGEAPGGGAGGGAGAARVGGRAGAGVGGSGSAAAAAHGQAGAGGAGAIGAWAGQPATGASSGEPAIDSLVALERELLFLYIEQPEVRLRLQEAFGRITWSDERHGAVATILLSLDAGEDAESLLSHLAARMPEASTLLSGVRLLDFAEIGPNRLAGMLMFNIREGQLKRAIRNENARLRRLDESEQTQRDDLFAHIATLQKDLSELRKKYRVE